VTSSIGLFTITRTGSSARAVNLNGSHIDSDTEPSTGIPDGNFRVGNANGSSNYSTKQYSLAFAGDGFNEFEINDIYTIINTYKWW
jgi:hypothetical protein